jgi:hypothetical protein
MISADLAEWRMRTLFYIGIALWIGLGIFLFFRYAILATQMMNHRVPKQSQLSIYYRKASDYTEVGQGYRQKAIRAWIALAVYAPTILVVVCWVWADMDSHRPH